jgi:hypothetical protein
MTHKLELEAALERSLRKQVAAPRLDGRFDAAVWARIEAAEQRAPRATRATAPSPASSRWLFIINAVGAGVTLLLIVYFGSQALGGVQVNVPSVAVPQVSAPVLDWLARVAGWIITAGALGFGFMFTSLGRKVRAELHQFL